MRNVLRGGDAENFPVKGCQAARVWLYAGPGDALMVVEV